MNFSNVSNLIDKVVETQARGTSLGSPTLYLHVSSTDPIEFNDASKVCLVVDKDDFVAYFKDYDKINNGTTVCLENCEVSLDYGTNNEVTACEIESKSVIIDFGNEKQKKVKNFTIKMHVNTDHEVPILPSTRRYLRRIQKQELAKKHWSKSQKVDIVGFFRAEKKGKKDDVVQNSQFGDLDTESFNILKKLKHFVEKEDLLRVAIKHPLRNKESKKIVRLMAVPNQ